MNEYKKWDYTGVGNKTRMGIYYLFKRSDNNEISDFLKWIKDEQFNFMSRHSDFLFTRLIEFKHFSHCEELCSQIDFDKKIAQTCASNLSVTFNRDSFDYWKNCVEKLNKIEQIEVIENFWSNFLSSQFLDSKYVKSGLDNLSYVFDKVPFYMDGNNSNLIENRKNFWTEHMLKLQPFERSEVFIKIGLLCAQKYDATVFMQEFKAYPNAVKAFDSIKLNDKLQDTLYHKSSINKKKI